MDATTAILERALDFRMKSHQVHSSNIANANVPGYKAQKVDFEAAFREALEGPEGSTRLAQEENLAQAVQSIRAEVYEDPSLEAKSNGNTVDMEREQVELAKNTLAYQAAIQLINKRFAMTKHVLSEGAR